MTMLSLVDSHCHLDHLDLSAFGGQIEECLNQAREQGIIHILSVCITLSQVANLIKLAEHYSNISVSVGLHPTEKEAEPTVAELINLAQHPKVVAIGETGLDYYRESGDMTWQQQRFRRHIQAAKAVNKPLIIHTRMASSDTLQIMREEGADAVGGVMHCFTENEETALAAIDMNFYISFSGILTFKNAVDLQALAKKLPLERLLIETDAPYLAPVPYRGKPNLPHYVRYVAESLAQLKGCSVAAVALQTTENFFRLFNKASRA